MKSRLASEDALFLLGIVLVIQKFFGNIEWSWWWVTTPFWGSALLITIILLIPSDIARKFEEERWAKIMKEFKGND